MEARLQPATEADLSALLPFVRAYHEFEGIRLDDESRKAALRPLLEPEGPGRIWWVLLEGARAGYLALCFGYSIELGGRDAFIDELFLAEPHRGRGLGKAVLAQVCEEAARSGVRALHLEVGRENRRARRLYERCGFRARERFFLMTRLFPVTRQIEPLEPLPESEESS